MSELKKTGIYILIVVLFFAGFIWLILNMPGTTVIYHDLKDRGTYMCVEDWGWKRTGYVKECFEFKRLR